ncbi:MAG: UbiX family flavin prenyltransferase [Chloroflexi bacterium]|nr:MAG: UbiX family flavin prenyltransferase [Chloroflexota bacterium]
MDFGFLTTYPKIKNMKRLIVAISGIAYSFSDNLLLRAADVIRKDRRRLVLVPRETPLHLGHLRMMVQVTEIGGIIVPPVPAFYHHPKTIDDIVNQTVNRVLDLLDIELPQDFFSRWQGGQANVDKP